MVLHEIIKALEELAPPFLQEGYDNSGLLVGDRMATCNKVLVALDCTEEIIQEAIDKGCNLVITHHPLIFSGLKKITGSGYVERTIIKAIKNDIAIYAIHTNLDNVFSGVNNEIGRRLGLVNLDILRKSSGNLRNLVTFVPEDHAGQLREALFDAGAGQIGKYDWCSFNLSGKGTFRPSSNANPYSGKKGRLSIENEIRIEVLYPVWKEKMILEAMRATHPYEEIAYYIHPLQNSYQDAGAGMIGLLEKAITEKDFISLVKKTFGGMVRFTRFSGKRIQKIAFCGGSGSFLLPDAIASGADVFLSSDFKYHQFFDAEAKILIVDVGHYESEQFTINLIGEYLNKKFPKFAVLFTSHITNPVNYT